MDEVRSGSTADAPEWHTEDEAGKRQVALKGSWRLFTSDGARQRLLRELSELEDPQQWTWDLTNISELDSAGAWLLWQAWGQQMPAELKCHKPYRQRFEQLAKADRIEKRSHWPSPIDMLDRFGAGLISIMRHTRDLVVLLIAVMTDFLVWTIRWRLLPHREITAEIYRTGVSSILLLGVVGFIIGIVMSLQIGATLSDFGANARIIDMLGLAILRELGPVITAIIQVGRAGSAITAGIAGMLLTEELDALKTFGDSPRMRLVSSRVAALVITMPLLVVWTDGMAILGGALTAQIDLDVPFQLFLARLPMTVSTYNFWFGLAKGVLFGLIIAIISSHFGLNARANTDSLSAQTTRSVVVGLTLILILDAVTGAILAKLGLM